MIGAEFVVRSKSRAGGGAVYLEDSTALGRINEARAEEGFCGAGRYAAGE
jgi:hypothetical protein